MIWSGYDVKIASAGTVLCEPAWAWDSRVMPDFDLWYVWQGRGTVRWEDQTCEVSPGTVFCLHPGRKYIARHDLQHRLGVCFVHFDFVDARGRRIELPQPQWPVHLTRLAEVDLHERLIKHLVTLHISGEPLARQTAGLLLRSVLFEMAQAASQPTLSGTQREHHDAIWAAARYIRENPGELFSIESLAERANYSADHFGRLFRQIVGQTPKEFCITTRMERAQTLLRESSMSVDQIAAALGYADVFFFSKQFKQRTGVAPTQWRKRA